MSHCVQRRWRPPPPANVADFDIEGFKLGMSEADVEAQLRKACIYGDFNTESETSGYKTYACHLGRLNTINITLADKTIYIFHSLIVEFPKNLSDADRVTMLDNLYDKMLEKYGQPAVEKPQTKKLSKISFIDGFFEEERGVCWGECTLENPEEEGIFTLGNPDTHYRLAAGQGLFAGGIVAAPRNSDLVSIRRVFVDVPAVTAKQEASEKALAAEIEAAQKQEEEAAQQALQQATDSVKF